MLFVSRVLHRSQRDPDKGELLVGVVSRKRDLAFALDEHWYRIPRENTRLVHGAWPPKWLALFESRNLSGGGAIRYYAKVVGNDLATRAELFPGEPAGAKTGRVYHRLALGPVLTREVPIRLVRPRPIAFITSTWAKFSSAETINDLWNDSPREDTLWAALKQQAFPAERQWPESVAGHRYILDFAMFCNEGKIDLETDGDTYHSGPHASARDNSRQNALLSKGWRTIRFNTPQLERDIDACIREIAAVVNNLKGFKDDGHIARTFVAEPKSLGQQLTLLS